MHTFKSFSLFTYDNFMTRYAIKKYTGSSEIPNPTDSAWVEVAKGEAS
jgi:hypothetical protein